MGPIEIDWVNKSVVGACNQILEYVNGRFTRARARHDALQARVDALEERVYNGVVNGVPEVFRKGFEDEDE